MKKKSFLKIGGAMLLMAIVLNIQYAWGDYGVKDHPLHLEVLAQNNDTGDRAKAAGEGSLWTKTVEECSVSAKGAAGSTVTIFGVKLKIEAGGEATLSVSKASTSCESGGNAQCSSLSCGDFWIRFAQAHGTAAAD
jgi:hypothetical protein